MTDTYARTTTSAWRNWAATATARPARAESPASVEELVDVVRRAGADGLKVKPVGTGHSFTATAATDGVLIRPDLLTGIRGIDPQGDDRHRGGRHSAQAPQHRARP
ncbi:hypothetical protein SMICM304S_07932 [Streptomyces microflavus]